MPRRTLIYLLDSNACIRFLNDSSSPLVKRLHEQRPSEVALSAVVKAELYYGARKSRRVEQNLALLDRFFAPFDCLSFDDRCAEHYGAIRSELERAGTPIGPNDLFIAATARAHDLALVTSNTSEFTRVVGLRVENWELA